MKAKSKISFIPLIYGIIITSLMLLIFGSTLFFSLLENWPGEIKEILQALVKWYDDPTGFFFTYHHWIYCNLVKATARFSDNYAGKHSDIRD